MRAKKLSPRKVVTMSVISIPSIEGLKEKVKIVRKFLNEKYNVDISQGHGLDLVSKVYGFQDWNTASAALKPNRKKTSAPTSIETVGDLRGALASYQDSDRIDAEFKFKLSDLLNQLNEYDDPESEVIQGFDLSVTDFDGRPELALILKHEDLYSEVTGMMRSLR